MNKFDQLRDRARAATLEAAVAQQSARLQLQVRQASLEKPLDPDIADLADAFHIDEQLARSFDAAMQTREDSYEQDFLTVWEHLEQAKDPADLLVNLIRDLINGTFVAKSRKHKDIVVMCETYKLDHMATRNLIEAMGIRERNGENIERDLEQLEVHLAHSSAPSKLVSMKLKEIRAGCNMGAVWHCCGDSKKKPKLREKEAPLDGGIGIEGVRGNGSKGGTYKSYRDDELQMRDEELNRKFGKSAVGGTPGGVMTEEEARKFVDGARRRDEQQELEREKRRPRSRSPTPRQSRNRRQRDDEAPIRRREGRDKEAKISRRQERREEKEEERLRWRDEMYRSRSRGHNRERSLSREGRGYSRRR